MPIPTATTMPIVSPAQASGNAPLPGALTLPTVPALAEAPAEADTYALFLVAVRESLTMRFAGRCGNPLGCTKRVALAEVMAKYASGPTGSAHVIPSGHNRHWARLVRTKQIVVSDARGSDAHYLPGACYRKTATGLVLDMDRVMQLVNTDVVGEEVQA